MEIMLARVLEGYPPPLWNFGKVLEFSVLQAVGVCKIVKTLGLRLKSCIHWVYGPVDRKLILDLPLFLLYRIGWGNLPLGSCCWVRG